LAVVFLTQGVLLAKFYVLSGYDLPSGKLSGQALTLLLADGGKQVRFDHFITNYENLL
jgi:hypothetical protein